MSEKKKQIVAALFLIFSIVIFLIALTWVKGWTIRKMQVLYIKLKDAGGLRINDPVDVGGVRKGKVASMRLMDNYVLVKLLIDPDVRIPADSRITMRNFSIMTGEKYIKIALGRSNRYLTDRDTVWAYYHDDYSITNITNALRKIDTLLQKLNPDEINQLVKEGLVSIIDRAEESVSFTAEEKRNISEIVDVLKEITFKLDTVVTALNQGEGTLGRLVKDTTLYNELRQTNIELKLLIEDIRKNPDRYFNVRLF